MKRSLIIRSLMLVAVIGLLIGAWQVAYARGKDEGTKEATSIRSEFTQARPVGGGGGTAPAAAGGDAAATPPAGGGRAKPGGAGNGGQFGAPAASGTVEKVDGTAVTVATSDGVVKVNVGERTQIRKQVTIPASELKSGDRVVVIGERSGDKEVNANAIQVQGPGAGQ